MCLWVFPFLRSSEWGEQMFGAFASVVTNNENYWGQFFEKAWQIGVIMSHAVMGAARRQHSQMDEPALAVTAALGVDAMVMTVPMRCEVT